MCFLQDVNETSDKKRKHDSEDEVIAKRRKVEVGVDDSDDICIIDSDDVPHSSELKKPTPRKRKASEDIDCLIVCDDKHND